jgi:hypothetical protein
MVSYVSIQVPVSDHRLMVASPNFNHFSMKDPIEYISHPSIRNHAEHFRLADNGPRCPLSGCAMMMYRLIHLDLLS